MDELVKAVCDLKAKLMKQFEALPTEIAQEFSKIETIVNEAAKEVPEKESEEGPVS